MDTKRNAASVLQQATRRARWVVKIGSSLLVNEGRGLDAERISDWVDQLSNLWRRGVEPVLISSGAVAEGMTRLGWQERPVQLPGLQAAAAVGQMGLMHAYEKHFNRNGLHAAQLLLTHDDFADRQRYHNVRATLRTLARFQAIPVINENDTVSTEEICFGDNDTLAALVANMIGAERLVILTDQQGLFTEDPRNCEHAKLISSACAEDARLSAMAGDAGALGRGGMASKLKAARLFALSGGSTTIVSGKIERVLERLRAGECIGTELLPGRQPLARRKQWLAGQVRTHGTVILHQEAMQALARGDARIHVEDVAAVQGSFSSGQMIRIQDTERRYDARGLSNYSANEMNGMVRQLASLRSGLEPTEARELVYRKNIIFDSYYS